MTPGRDLSAAGLTAMRRVLEERIAALAARQHGVVTRRQLLDAGLTSSAVDRRVESRRLRLLHRGVYLTLPFPLAHTREMAAVLASGAGAVVSHASAATLRGWEADDGGKVDVAVAGNRGQRPGIRAHRIEKLASCERTLLDGIPVTTPARTLLDLASMIETRSLEAALARAEREGSIKPGEIEAMLGRHAGHPGAPALRSVLRMAGGPALTRSAAEEKFLTLIREAGLATPECNVSVGRYEVDFLWRAARIGVEVDGFRYHSSRPRFEGDRRKDAQLLAAGIAVMRLSWRQITEERTATAVQLAVALARAGDRR